MNPQEAFEIAYHTLEGQPCIFCTFPTDGMGLFMPKDSQAWGSPKGKQRCIFYPICSNCLGIVSPEYIESFCERHFKDDVKIN